MNDCTHQRKNSAALGWDIGGAHLKAAWLSPDGICQQVYQQPCPLWQGMDKLQQATACILKQLPTLPFQHVVTMTGELVDLFDNREQGVQAIIDAMQVSLGVTELKVFAAPGRFINSTSLNSQDYLDIASANWLASLNYCAEKVTNALFVDIGSTTTDLLIIKDRSTEIKGYTDYQRLCSGELIYTGIVRTPVMAIDRQTRFEGHTVGMMAELFATMADVYRLTGELNENHDQAESADGGPKTEIASALRLSRMIGCDFQQSQLAKWRQLAEQLRQQQFEQLRTACEQQLNRAEFTDEPTLIGAGIGRFLAQQLADDLAYPYLDFDRVFETPLGYTGMTAADCAPAASVAGLALKCSEYEI